RKGGRGLLYRPSFAERFNRASPFVESISVDISISDEISDAETPRGRIAELRDAPGIIPKRLPLAQREISRPEATDTEQPLTRPHVKGKFFFVGEEKLWVRGVTYGTFSPDESGANYPSPDAVERDFTAIRSAGLNSLRVYTVPPPWLL